MRKRIIVTLCAALGIVGAGNVAALADTADRSGAYWACVGIDQIDFGACQKNPLPRELPEAPDQARVLPPE